MDASKQLSLTPKLSANKNTNYIIQLQKPNKIHRLLGLSKPKQKHNNNPLPQLKSPKEVQDVLDLLNVMVCNGLHSRKSLNSVRQLNNYFDKNIIGH